MLETCPIMKKEIRSESPLIYTLTFAKKESNLREKAFIIFGEHARELISVETGLNLISLLCSSDRYISVSGRQESSIYPP
jgi:hypothetical protein